MISSISLFLLIRARQYFQLREYNYHSNGIGDDLVHTTKRSFINLPQPLLRQLVQLEKLTQLVPRHVSTVRILFLLLVSVVLLVADLLPSLYAVLLKQLLSVGNVVLFVFFRTLLLRRRGRLRKLDVVLNDLVSEDHSFVRPPNPGSFGLDFDGGHRELFHYLLLEFGGDVGLFDVGQAEEYSGANVDSQWQSDFREDGAESVLHGEGYDRDFLLFVGLYVFILHHLHDQSHQFQVLVFDLPSRQVVDDFHQTLVGECVVLLHDVAESEIVLDFVVVEGQVCEGQTVEFTEELLVVLSQVLVVLEMLLNQRQGPQEVRSGSCEVLAVEVHDSFIELIVVFFNQHSELARRPLLRLLHPVDDAGVVVEVLFAALPKALQDIIVEEHFRVLPNVQHHLHVVEAVEDVLYDQEALDLVEQHIKVFVYVVDIRVGSVCVFVGTDVEEQVTRPDVDLWSVLLCHVGLQVDKSSVDFIRQNHALGSVEVSIRNLVFLVVFDGSFELANCFCVFSCLCEDQADEIEHHRVGFGAFVKALVEILQSFIEVSESIVEQSSNHEQRRVVLYLFQLPLIFLSYCLHC